MTPTETEYCGKPAPRISSAMSGFSSTWQVHAFDECHSSLRGRSANSIQHPLVLPRPVDHRD